MNNKVWPEIRCLGSTMVGPRGQAVIPANARKELGLETGTTLLVFKAFQGEGLVLLKVDTIERLLGMVSKYLPNFEKALKDYKQPEVQAEGKGVSR